MTLDPSAAGRETPPHVLDYDFRTVVLYALGVGAKAGELDYLYEGRGPKVFPTFAVVPAYAPIFSLLQVTGGDLRTMVHGAQSITLVRPIPPSGKFVTTARVEGVYDMKRLAQMICTTESKIDDSVVCRTEWQFLFRDAGGFGGPHPPRALSPKPADGASPSFESEETISAEQALLYRLSGDTNPLHADPEFARMVGFERGPILHGLATLGFVTRAVVAKACDGDGDRVRSLRMQFKKPVWPGESLRTVAYPAESALAVRAYAGGRDDVVVSGHVELVR
jgi:acyl dehydratase